MALERITRGMREAGSFVELASVLCRALRDELEVNGVLDLFSCTGEPVLAADDFPLDEMPGDDRVAYLRGGYRLDLLRTAMFATERAVGSDLIGFDRVLAYARRLGFRGAPCHAHYLPLVGEAGVIGALRCARPAPMSSALVRDLDTLSRRLSARLAFLGITAVEELPASRPLTTRQLEVATLAGRDLTNREIAGTLAISQNSVKKHLKQAFDRLAIDNRRELGGLLARAQPAADVPVGVSRVGPLVVVHVPSPGRLARASTPPVVG